MSRRIFVNVSRGMTDKTAVCVFPWEVDILSLVHGQEIKEVTIDQMCDLQGPVKVDKHKLKHSKFEPPELRAQLEIMTYVPPDEDPALDPAGEYNRMVEKYGMDKDVPFPCVTRVFGEFSSGAFTAKLSEYAQDRAEKPAALKAVEEGLSKAPDQMTVKELRDALTEREVPWKVTEGKLALIDKLESVLVT